MTTTDHLTEHFMSGLTDDIFQWCDLAEKCQIVALAKTIQYKSESAAAVLTPENVDLLGARLAAASPQTLAAANVTRDITRSGCNEPVTVYLWRGIRIAEHFAGDRCNAPAGPNGWSW